MIHQPNEHETSFSIASLARIAGPDNTILFLRNKSTKERTGRTVFSLVGGAVEAPIDFPWPSFFTEHLVTPEREPVSGKIDLRFRLGRAAAIEPEKLRLRKAINEIIDGLGHIAVSPAREVIEELVEEEGIIPADMLDVARISAVPLRRHVFCEPHRAAPETGNRVFSFSIYDVTLPPEAQTLLVQKALFDPDESRIVFASKGEVTGAHRLMFVQPIAQAVFSHRSLA